MVSAFAHRPVKVTMTGPHMLAAVAHDEHYGDPRAFTLDLAEVLTANFRELQAADCEHVQVDEPLFAASGATRLPRPSRRSTRRWRAARPGDERPRSLPSGEVAAVGLLVPDLGPGWLHRGAGTGLEQQRAHLACSRSGRVVALGGRHD
jgi:hypothetical protein